MHERAVPVTRGHGGGPGRGRGFSLIELAVVIAVIGLLLGTLLPPLVAQLQIREVREAQQHMRTVHDALIGFAQSRGRLPCPDAFPNLDGRENCTTPPTSTGGLPWHDLGLPAFDGWGRYLVYTVSPEFTQQALPGAPPGAQLDLSDSGVVTVRGDRDNGKAPLEITDKAAAVVVSPGANGHCGWQRDPVTGAPKRLAPPDDGARWSCAGPTGAGEADEYENVDGDNEYVARQRSEGGDGCDDATGSGGPLCAFDDLVVWVPHTLLLGKLVEAGWLP